MHHYLKRNCLYQKFPHLYPVGWTKDGSHIVSAMTSYGSQQHVINSNDNAKAMCSQQDCTYDVFGDSFNSNDEERASFDPQRHFFCDEDYDEPLSETSLAVQHIQKCSGTPVSPQSENDDSVCGHRSQSSVGSTQLSGRIEDVMYGNPQTSQLSSSESEIESDSGHFDEIFAVDSVDHALSLIVEPEVMDHEELSSQSSKELFSTYSSDFSNVDGGEQMDTSFFNSDSGSEPSGCAYTKTRTISYVSSNAASISWFDHSIAASQLSYTTAKSEVSQASFKAPIAKKRVRSNSEVDTSYLSASSSQPVQPSEKRMKPAEEVVIGGIIWSFGNDMFCLTEHSLEIYDYMRLKESSCPLSHFFLAGQKEVTEELRRAVVCKLLCSKPLYKLSELTTHLAIYILDKCLDGFQISSRLLQDVAALCLVIASKMEDYNCFRMADVIRLNISSSSDKSLLSAIEKKIMLELDFKFSYSTPFSYAGYYLVHLKSTALQIMTAYYLLELSLLDSRLRNYSGTSVAHAVVCLAHSLSSPNKNSSLHSLQDAERSLLAASRIVPLSTRSIMQMILDLTTNDGDEFDAIRIFYSEVGTLSVSSLPVPLELIEAVSVGGSRRLNI